MDKTYVLRAKKFGVFIQDARENAGRSLESFAESIGMSAAQLSAIENGEQAPSLPELELIAYYLNIPLSHFWGNTVLQANGGPRKTAEKFSKLKSIRQKLIGIQVRQRRESRGLGQDSLAEATGILPGDLEAYENGGSGIPLPHLETLAAALDLTIQDFFDSHGPVGDWLREKKSSELLNDMPEDLQDFVIKPYNRPFIEIAKKLSEMDVQRLRSVAEGILDITL